MILNCPSCGAEVEFKSRSSIFGVCSFCSSTLVRHDLDLENLGKMATLPPDLSPLQIGTSGIYEGSKFEIVGRQKISYSQGTWNEWYLFFDDGRDAWLADAQGFYMLSFQLRDEISIPPLSQMQAGATVSLAGKTFKVDDVREVKCTGSQGELPVKSVIGRVSTSVDLSGPQKQFAGLDYSTEGDRVFMGSYREFEELKFMNLRELDGW